MSARDDGDPATRRAHVTSLLGEVAVIEPVLASELLTELVAVHELRVALEILWDNVHELGVVLPPTLHEALVSASQRVGVDASYWQPPARGAGGHTGDH
jgi:hypothetical protein